MAVEVTFNDNLDEVLHLLTSATAQALLDIGVTVQEAAAANSPVRTGALRGSWTVQVNEGEGSVKIGVPYDALDGNYAKYVELGTSRQIARHMLRDAVESNKGEFKNIINITFITFKNA